MILIFLFFILPILSIVYFAVCLWKYFIARKKWRRESNNSNQQIMKDRGLMLIHGSIIFGVVAVILIAIIVIFSQSIAYM